jgi:hypothetical protein
MASKTKHFKTAVVCMVQSGYEYICEFLLHHLNICDHIYIIDHNSERDLRNVTIDRVTVVRSNHIAWFHSESVNLVTEHFDIRGLYDWLFVLDVDEYLPFTKKQKFQEFLSEHQSDYVVQMSWRNGVPFHENEDEIPISLVDCESIRFFSKKSHLSKSFINIGKTKGDFVVPAGAHNTKMRSQLKKIYEPGKTDYSLFHIPAFCKSQFVEKLNTIAHQIELRNHVIKGLGGLATIDYPNDYSNQNTWLWYIANYRVRHAEQFYETSLEDFQEKMIFSHLDRNEVKALHEHIKEGPLCRTTLATVEELEYRKYKSDERRILDNMKWFRIDQNNQILSVKP